MITIDKIEEVTVDVVIKCIKKHLSEASRLKKLENYYDGKHAILNDSERKNKTICNHSEYITDMAVSYVHGSPVSYSSQDNNVQDYINLIFDDEEDSHNNELAENISVFGKGLELVYMSDDDKPVPKFDSLSPLKAFLVCDNSIYHKKLFAVTYEKLDEEYAVYVYTDKCEREYRGKNLTHLTFIEEHEHHFGDVPVIEYSNNKKQTGDFEKVISLIDAYNVLQSDRIADKEAFVDAFLVINQSLGDTADERSETAKLMKKERVLELDSDGRASWLIKTLNESEVEVLRKALKADIHEFSKVPDMTDENFASNSSGIAMRYKLLGLEELGKRKERYFKKGLRERLKLISNIEETRSNKFDYKEISILMKRSLPIDEEMQARIANETKDFISWETRVKRFNEDLDVEQEKKQLQEERAESMKNFVDMTGAFNE